jgi:hypothetical protein
MPIPADACSIRGPRRSVSCLQSAHHGRRDGPTSCTASEARTRVQPFHPANDLRWRWPRGRRLCRRPKDRAGRGDRLRLRLALMLLDDPRAVLQVDVAVGKLRHSRHEGRSAEFEVGCSAEHLSVRWLSIFSCSARRKNSGFPANINSPNQFPSFGQIDADLSFLASSRATTQ